MIWYSIARFQRLLVIGPLKKHDEKVVEFYLKDKQDTTQMLCERTTIYQRSAKGSVAEKARISSIIERLSGDEALKADRTFSEQYQC